VLRRKKVDAKLIESFDVQQGGNGLGTRHQSKNLLRIYQLQMAPLVPHDFMRDKCCHLTSCLHLMEP